VIDSLLGLEIIDEIDRRKLWAEDACGSMFAWCLEYFHMSEAMVSKRLRAARTARAYQGQRSHEALCNDLPSAFQRQALQGTVRAAYDLSNQSGEALVRLNPVGHSLSPVLHW